MIIMENQIYPTIKNSILLCLLLLLFNVVFALALIYIFWPNFDLSDYSLLGEFFASVICWVIVLFIGFKKTKRKFNEVFKFNKVPPFLWFATTIFIIGFVIVASELDNLLNFVLPIHETFPMLLEWIEEMATQKSFAMAIISIGIMPAFMEELFFRGLILDGLKNNYSTRKAIVVSALLFGIIHLNPWQFLTAFIIGLFSAWIYISTNSILLSIYIHLFNNVLVVIAIRFQKIDITAVEFQPIWLNLAGLSIFVLGIILLKKGFAKVKTTT